MLIIAILGILVHGLVLAWGVYAHKILYIMISAGITVLFYVYLLFPLGSRHHYAYLPFLIFAVGFGKICLISNSPILGCDYPWTHWAYGIPSLRSNQMAKLLEDSVGEDAGRYYQGFWYVFYSFMTSSMCELVFSMCFPSKTFCKYNSQSHLHKPRNYRLEYG